MGRLEDVARQGWHLVPAGVRASPRLAGPKRLALRAVGRPAEPVEVVHTLDELDAALARLDAAAAVSDDQLRRAFQSFRMELDLDLPPDPASDAYAQGIFELYAWLHGSPYDPSHEVTPLDVEAAADVPFPYATQSARTVGQHLMAVGHVIRTLDLGAGSRVLELGPGWGNTTLALARMGCAVTAVDIEPRFVELIRTRADRIHADIDARVGDFSLVRELEGPYDAVLFFECFHHCADHRGLLADLSRVVAPGGKVVFAAEPIETAFPVPWGLRLDGESLWAIRRHGWLELGFRESYFLGTLAQFGWSVRKRVCADTPWGVCYVATRT
jgi:protein-L-isoaspartate O-methyltransferase